MSTYVALLDDGTREEPIDVRRAGPNLYEVRVRGKVHLVDAFRHGPDTLSLIVDRASYSATLDWRDARVSVRLRQAVVPLEILGEPELRLRRAAGEFTVEGRQTVVAPLPGRIVKVLVSPGDEVKRGQALVVVEAMKMENEMKSPKDGRIVEVHVREGRSVEGGASLCAVE